MAAVEEVEEHVRGGGLVACALDLSEAHIIDDEELDAGPAAEAFGVGAVGETGVEVVEKVDTTGVADEELALAGTERDGLEQVALAGAALARKEKVLVLIDEAQTGEGLDGSAIEIGLKGPIEGFEGLSHLEPAGIDPTFDAALALLAGGLAEDALDEDERRRLLAMCKGE